MLDKLPDSIVKVLNALTWQKVLQLLLLIIVLAIGTTFYETRTHIYQSFGLNASSFVVAKIPNPSNQTITNIHNLVDRSKEIVGVQLVNFDIIKNEKKPVYFYSDKPELTKAMDNYESMRATNSPLFVVGDEAGNERIVNILNSDFVCTPLPSKLALNVPLAATEAVAFCSISIPPYYGKVIGFVNLWMDHMPNATEIPNFRAIARTLSIDVFERDVSKGHDDKM